MALGSALLLTGPLAAEIPFTEEAAARGVSYVTTGGNFHGRGSAFVDLDGDGDADFVCVGAANGAIGVFENDGSGHFTDRSATTGMLPFDQAASVSAGDYDGDGDLDLHIGGWAVPDRLYRNEGGFTFTDVASAVGVDGGGRATGCCWGDFDLDGRLDLYVANWSDPNRLYRNEGDDGFDEVAVQLGVDAGLDPTFQASFFDYDLDGDVDLYLVTDRGMLCESLGFHNHLFENVGGTFIDVTEESGTEACVDAMCIALGDLDCNGHPDIYCTNTPSGNALLMNAGTGAFTCEAEAAGVSVYETGWGAHMFDLNHDGWEDLLVANAGAANQLFIGGPLWPLEEAAAAYGVDTGGLSYGINYADIDGDGDLDVAVQNNDEAIRLFVNHEGEQHPWVRLRVADVGPNRHGIGATIRARTGEHWQIRQVIAGSGFKGQNELTLHLGLGGAAAVDELEVVWSGDRTRTLTGLAANTTWSLYPPERVFDADGDADRDLDDFAHLLACGGPLIPGCEMMDGDGNAVIDAGDAAAFVRAFDGPLLDCNGNGVADLLEIAEALEPDDNGNGVLDACEALGDLDGDGLVDVADLVTVVTGWGPCPSVGCMGDASADGSVDVSDLLIVILNWGSSPDG